MPFFAIVDPQYLSSNARIGIPITADVPYWPPKYIYITYDLDEH